MISGNKKRNFLRKIASRVNGLSPGIIQMVSPATIKKGKLLKPMTKFQCMSIFEIMSSDFLVDYIFGNAYITKDFRQFLIVLYLPYRMKKYFEDGDPYIEIYLDIKNPYSSLIKAMKEDIDPIIKSIYGDRTKVSLEKNNNFIKFLVDFDKIIFQTSKYAIVDHKTAFNNKFIFFRVFRLKTLQFQHDVTSNKKLFGILLDNLLLITPEFDFLNTKLDLFGVTKFKLFYKLE